MRILQLGFAVVGCLLPIAPAGAQNSSPNRVKIREMREALLGRLLSGPDLATRLEGIRESTRAETLLILNSGRGTPVDVDDQIRSLLREGQPTSIIRKRLNGTDFVVVGYSIIHGMSAIPDSAPVIEAFRSNGSMYEAVAHTGEALERSAAKLEELPSPWSTELWILAHGQQSRVMQYHEKIAIYSFDGSRFKELWVAAAPLRSPRFEIAKGALRISYEDEERSGPLLVKTIGLTQSGAVEIGTLPQN